MNQYKIVDLFIEDNIIFNTKSFKYRILTWDGSSPTEQMFFKYEVSEEFLANISESGMISVLAAKISANYDKNLLEAMISYHTSINGLIPKGIGGQTTNVEELSKQLPGVEQIAVHPVAKNVNSIRNIIINLNDVHKWTREQIADWLDSLDVDLTFKVKEGSNEQD
jgi:hypothetical protein